MTLTIDFPPSVAKRIEAMSSAAGIDVETFIREVVEAKVAERTRPSFDYLKPLHDEVEQSGITDDELEKLIDEAITDVRADGHVRSSL